MKVGDKVALFSHDGFRRFLTITETGIPSGVNNLTCYKTNEGSTFYMKPESSTGKHYNGNRAFWIRRIPFDDL